MLQSSEFTFEICVETPDALICAAKYADRIELCAGLDMGGLTPSVGLMEQAKVLGIETHALIRPKCGDFQMSPNDLAIAVADIKIARQIGLQGVVIGAEQDGALDRHALDLMVQAADCMDVTLHRVIDILDDPIIAMEVAIEYDIKRILTSGSAMSAPKGIAGLARLQAASAGRIEIMAGAGITSDNIGTILEQTAITSFHASCSAKSALEQRYVQFGFGEVKRTFDPQEAARLASRLEASSTVSPDLT